jgi:hypothetical protein
MTIRRAATIRKVLRATQGVMMAKPFKGTINVDIQFTGGVIDRVAIDVSGEPYHDLEREAALMLMRE